MMEFRTSYEYSLFCTDAIFNTGHVKISRKWAIQLDDV